MRCYYIDGSGLALSDRISVSKQLESLGYIYNPVPHLSEFTFYAEDYELVDDSLKLPNGCVLEEIR